MKALTLLDYLAFLSLFICWIAYSVYSKQRITAKADSLININHSLRVHWMRRFIQHPNRFRISDAQVVGIIHRGTTFFISTTILVIAGLMAILSSGDTVSTVLDELPYHADNIHLTWSFKIVCMLLIFVFAFFRLTWSLRQSHNYLVAMYGAPFSKQYDSAIDELVEKLALMMTDSSKNFNNALRSYYFGLSILSWLIHPALFIATNCLVIWVLYRREFSSRSLRILKDVNDFYNEVFNQEKYSSYGSE